MTNLITGYYVIRLKTNLLSFIFLDLPIYIYTYNEKKVIIYIYISLLEITRFLCKSFFFNSIYGLRLFVFRD